MSHYVFGRPQRVSGTITVTTGGFAKIPFAGNAGYITGVQGAVAVDLRFSASAVASGVVTGDQIVITKANVAPVLCWGNPAATGIANVSVAYTAAATANATILATNGILPGMVVASRAATSHITDPTRIVEFTTGNTIFTVAPQPTAGTDTCDFFYADPPSTTAQVTVTGPTTINLVTGASADAGPILRLTPAVGPVFLATSMAIMVKGIQWAAKATPNTVTTIPTNGVVILCECWPVFLADGQQAYTDLGNPTPGTAMPTTTNLV